MSIVWPDVVATAKKELVVRNLNEAYADRLGFEIIEIEKQGAEAVWVGYVNNKKRFVGNPNNLLIPWLFGLVDEDPLLNRKTPIINSVKASTIAAFKEANGFVPHDLIKDPDNPDIDVDCLPEARDPLKEYAIQRYGQNFNDGYGSVCSVGTWQTYKFKSAIVDSMVALGLAPRGRGDGSVGRPGVNYVLAKADSHTKDLPEDVDELREGGLATCKGKIIIEKNGRREEQECGYKYNGLKVDVNGTVEVIKNLDGTNSVEHVKCPKCDSDETDGPHLGQLLQEYPTELLRLLIPPKTDIRLLETAANLVGRIRNMGMHAGAIIITDRPLYGNIPLAKSGKNNHWVSMWTEGRSTQLSKLGYVKWDWLGLKTLKYIFNCCKLISENRGITFGENMDGMVEYNNYTLRHGGYYIDNKGKKHFISLDDPDALRLANEQKTDGVFQFDTDLAKSILANGVRSFEDLMLFNAMGHPGPMQSIPDAVKNRDDSRGIWKKRMRPEFLKVLEDTYGTICYQEQLQALWQNIAGFTSPEAQEARKAVAKKHTHKFKPIEEKWLAGASKLIGENEARDWWNKMVTFGRYAFNRSHAVSYCLVAFKCLWLKAHFAPEYWAAVMSDCHPDKLVRFMGVARSEEWHPTDVTNCSIKHEGDGLGFGAVNVDNITINYTVSGNTINQGLIGIKGIGKAAAAIFHGRGEYSHIDQLVASAPKRQSKTVMERFIKLGVFRHLPDHENSNALWYYYQFKYCKSGKKMTELRNTIRKQALEANGWTPKTILEERRRQEAAWKRQFPKKKVTPKRIVNWIPKPIVTLKVIKDLYPDDFPVDQKLQHQHDYLGFWFDSPLDIYECEGGCTIEEAKTLAKKEQCEVKLEGIITDIQDGTTKKGSPFLRVFITDGLQHALVFVWSNEIGPVLADTRSLQKGTGVNMYVDYDDKRGTFSLARREVIRRLMPKGYSKRNHAT